jgi:hypothetical protein
MILPPSGGSLFFWARNRRAARRCSQATEASRKDDPVAKNLAIALVVLLLAIVAWGLFLESSGVTIVINGQQVTGPLEGAIGAAGLVVAVIALFCAAILLVFVFAGMGIIVLGGVVFVGMILAWLAFPFLLPLLIPLAILWGFVAMAPKTTSS